MVFSFRRFSLLIIILVSFLNAQSIKYKANRVKIQQKQKIIILDGNAFIRKGADQGLKADKIIWNQKTKIAEAFNNISFLNKKQGIVYRGDYLIFYIDRDEVLIKENASIEEKKNNLTVYADSFTSKTRENIVNGDGNVRMNLIKGNKTILINGEKIVHNQQENLFKVYRKVKITQKKNKPSPAAEKKISSDDYDVYCEEATFYNENEFLECRIDARAVNRNGNSILYGDKIIFNSEKEELLADKEVHYLSWEGSETNEAFSDKLSILEAEKKLTMEGKVKLIKKDRDQLKYSLDCQKMNYLFRDEEEYLECFDEVVLFSKDRNIKSKSDYLYYDFLTQKGFVNKSPHLVREGEESSDFIYADRIDVDDRVKKVYYSNNVKIEQVDLVKNEVINETTCLRGIFDYRREKEEIFNCYDDVIVYNPEEEIRFYGDNLTTYFKDNYSLLRTNVYFIQDISQTNYLRGEAEYLENYSSSQYALFNDQVEIIEFNDRDEKISVFNSQRAKYDYSGEYNLMEGFGDVKINNLSEGTTLYSNYFFYNQALSYSYALGDPLLVQKKGEGEEDSFVYSDRIELYNQERVARMNTNIVMFSSANFKNNLPSRKFDAQKLAVNEYITCEKGNYFFLENEKENFECLEEFQYLNDLDKMTVTSDYMLFDIDESHAFLEKNPVVFKRSVTNHYFTYSDTMDLYLKEKEIFFNTNVLMARKNIFSNEINGGTNGTITCDNSKYSYLGEEILECFQNVVILDFENDTMTTGDYMKFYVTNEYVYLSEQPEFYWNREGETTYVKGDVFERFEKEEVMYVKGNVFIDDGVNEGESSLGIYDMREDLFILYSNPKIKDKKGSEFFSDEVTFDLEEKKLILDTGVTGVLQLE